ncbi:kelch-like protein 17 [Arctopsyche grandis]|uniref:kelch-like protein 17 n=1 Tax=Arctopsyche grandis TaxID=121162 RepID=UPI00406D633A
MGLVNLANCLKILKQTADPKSKKKAMDLILENFETLHKTRDFLKLPVSNVIEILKSNDLITPSEEDVFNSVKLWVNHDEKKRRNELAQLMSSVRLSLLSLEFIVDDVLMFCLLCEECMVHVRRAIIDKSNHSSIQTDTPRRKKENKA